MIEILNLKLLLMVLMDKKFLEHFTKMNCKNQIQKNLGLKNITYKKRQSDKLNVKWKGNNNLFNSWIDKKDIV